VKTEKKNQLQRESRRKKREKKDGGMGSFFSLLILVCVKTKKKKAELNRKALSFPTSHPALLVTSQKAQFFH
jgi:hypothetical protein